MRVLTFLAAAGLLSAALPAYADISDRNPNVHHIYNSNGELISTPDNQYRGYKRSSAIKREVVDYDTHYKPGTIIVDTEERRLYLVQENGKALKFGVGVGRPGFQWAGTHRVSRKAEWPGWTPPPAMRKRQPGLPAYMEGGIQNPLGARALYLGSSIYRIHGSNEPHTIGQAVSSGCIRMTNEDVEYLYELVDVGAKVVVVR
jgi:lipoprotein-anchoring transpeptidase ErfK/SrfK